MRFRRTVVAVATAGSLTVLGAGIAQANDMRAEVKPEKKVHKEEKRKPAKPVKPMKKQKKVAVDLHQQQDCTYQALIPINVAILNVDANAGSFHCDQGGRIG